MMHVIKIHSLTDLITNSSTVIYTYQDNSVEAFREMMQEICNVFGVTEKVDDMFNLLLVRERDYSSFFENCDPEEISELVEEIGRAKGTVFNLDEIGDSSNYDEMLDFVNETHGEVMIGGSAPEWFNKLNDKINDHETDSDNPPESELHIRAKDPKYETLAKLFVKFLNSAEQEESRDG